MHMQAEVQGLPGWRRKIPGESEGCTFTKDQSHDSSCLFFQFGESQKLRLVRILRSTVMVRVGGGWVALDEFLVKNDPCRGKLLRTFLVIASEFMLLALLYST